MIKYISEYRNRELISAVLDEIARIHRKPVTFMEVCGGHTMSLHKNGIPSLLPSSIKLLSGPGCPVCVTSRSFIDCAVELGKIRNTVIATFGDLVRVPGTYSSLEKEKAEGHDIRIVYSSSDALEIAADNPDKKIVFLGIGFETTAPSSAAAVLKAAEKNLENFFLLSAHKVMPPAMSALIDSGVRINGYICPGHVSTVTGSKIYDPIVKKYGIGCVVSGFEPLDLLQAILMLVKQCESGHPAVENQYIRAVTTEGNTKAQQLMQMVFEPVDDWWRGLGTILGSGLKLKERYEEFDAFRHFDVSVNPENEEAEEAGCRCADVLKGLITPPQCPLFSVKCTPSDPVGACMVSSEGACAAWYRYSGKEAAL